MKIALVGGGTVGHIAPSQSLINAIKELDSNTQHFYVAANNKVDIKYLSSQKEKSYFLPVAKLRRYLDIQNFTDIFNFIKAFYSSLKILKTEKPDLVFSKGGYVSVPFCLAAYLKRIPIILHESDSSLGLANKLILPLTTQIWLSHPNCLVKRYLFKTYVVKLPIKDSIMNPNSGFEFAEYLDPNLKNLLVIGGSLGAKHINDFIYESKDIINSHYNIIHVVGSRDFDSKHKITQKYIPLEFVNDLGPIYQITDVCISRAGAGTLNELEALRIPTILIPLTGGQSRGDQLLNAEYFVEKNKFGTILLESNLNLDKLIPSLNSLPGRIFVYSTKSKDKNNTKLYDLILSAANKPK